MRLAKEWFAARVSKTALDGGSCRMNLTTEGGGEPSTGGGLTSIGDGFEEPSDGVMNAVYSGGGKKGGPFLRVVARPLIDLFSLRNRCRE